LIIRDAQTEELGKSYQKRFVERMLRHLRAMFAEKLADRSDEELRELIRDGIENAADYEITIEYDVSRFIEYMVIFGEDFDIDEKTYWAGNILNKSENSGTEKMNEMDYYVNAIAFGASGNKK
jgi:hypothetical protein